MDGLRLAMLSLHTSPDDQPGRGDAGGMNVYVRSVAEELAARGASVDVFTRCAGRGVPDVVELADGVRVLQAQAGPCAPVAKDELDELLPRFVLSVLASAPGPYDLIHGHYWLSGRAGLALRDRWDAPLVASFHTLAAVKALAGFAEPETRLRGERAVTAAADRLVASTPEEAAHLVHLYGADPNRVRVVAPGVDLGRFAPGPAGRREAPTALFVGRLHALKGADVAIRAVAEAIAEGDDTLRGLRLLIVGGDAADGTVEELRALAASLGVADRIAFAGTVPHEQLPALYRSADVLVAPSRSEAFGLAALEAQASGVPVIASAVGGLRTVVADAVTGFLVPPDDPRALAERLRSVLAAPRLRDAMGRRARVRAERLSWQRTVDGLLGVYGELVGETEAVAGG